VPTQSYEVVGIMKEVEIPDEYMETVTIEIPTIVEVEVEI